jgi:hypothetical protein
MFSARINQSWFLGVFWTRIPQSTAEEFQRGNLDVIKLKLIEGAGHMPQEDWY